MVDISFALVNNHDINTVVIQGSIVSQLEPSDQCSHEELQTVRRCELIKEYVSRYVAVDVYSELLRKVK